MDIRENKEAHQAYLLEKINRAFAELGSSAKWKRAPEFQPEYESLKDKRTLIVEDVKGVLENLLPELIVATDGQAGYIHYSGEELEALAQQILDKNPDLLLMDYHLSDRLKGSDVLKLLGEKGYTGKAVGLSSDSGTNRQFTQAGAIGCIDKGGAMPEDTIKQLGQLIK